MLNADFCIQILRKFFGNLSGNPVLSKGCLYENIDRCDKKKQGQKKPFQYFFKSPQVQLFKL